MGPNSQLTDYELETLPSVPSSPGKILSQGKVDWYVNLIKVLMI